MASGKNKTTNDMLAKKININRVIRLGSTKLTVLEYLRDTDYPAELISIMADENCDPLEAATIMQNRKLIKKGV